MTTRQHTLAIIGGGAAGLTAAEVAATLGIDVALIEGNKLGGECTWVGCIPSKTLLTAAKAAHTARTSASMGIHVDNLTVDFAQVMRYVKQTIEDVYTAEDAKTLREHGVIIYEAYAQFADPHTPDPQHRRHHHSQENHSCNGREKYHSARL